MEGRLALAWLLVLLTSPTAWGSAEFIPIQEMAQGQSLGGANLLNDSLYSNPAASAFTQVYAIEGSYLSPKGFAASILDTRTSEVGGGLAYFRKPVKDYETPLQGARLNLLGRVSNAVGFGIGGKALWGPQLNGDQGGFKDLDAGVLANLSPIQVGVSLRNILGGAESFEQSREWILGGRINYQEILFFSLSTIFPHAKWTPVQYGLGAEFITPYYVALKGGYRIRPESHSSYWSAGASFLAPKLSLHYGAEFPNQPTEAIEHMVAATLLF